MYSAGRGKSCWQRRGEVEAEGWIVVLLLLRDRGGKDVKLKKRRAMGGVLSSGADFGEDNVTRRGGAAGSIGLDIPCPSSSSFCYNRLGQGCGYNWVSTVETLLMVKLIEARVERKEKRDDGVF